MAFSKLLIANRGEIACRIARTARTLGYRTVAVFSDADRESLHVTVCDEAVRIGPAEARESYLNVDALLLAARLSGADAVHPGYGFLSENELFAQACTDAGLTFVGPPAAAIRAMGNKAAAKRRMIEAGVPCVPGYQGNAQDDATLSAEAHRIGLPIMVKAAAGGGGRGMRLVVKVDELPRALIGARSEAENAFGSGELILEKAVVEPRHIEIQVFADGFGQVIHLGERDCSIQRRHQKVIEEAPSPAVSPDLRARMGEAAVAAARAIGYVGAGTVEFLLDRDGQFYFLEMNTRLQVEHPVTEAITGLDLVAWQLQVAAGDALPLRQEQVTFSGHAIEARLYAEDPYRSFLPQSGWVEHWEPAQGAGIRIDHGLKTRQEVTPHYDPMIAKVIAHGANRETARRRLLGALQDTVAFGPNTNKAFLAAILAHPSFAAGEATTAFIGQHFAPKSAAMQRPSPGPHLQALAAALFAEQSGPDSQGLLRGWRSSGVGLWPLKLTVNGMEIAASAEIMASRRYRIRLGDERIIIALGEQDGVHLRFEADGHVRRAAMLRLGQVLHLELDGLAARFEEVLHRPRAAAEAGSDGRVLAPMNGRIVAVFAKPGEKVVKGQRLLVLEAMKMQHEIAALLEGAISTVSVREGDQVATRQLLIQIDGSPANP